MFYIHYFFIIQYTCTSQNTLRYIIGYLSRIMKLFCPCKILLDLLSICQEHIGISSFLCSFLFLLQYQTRLHSWDIFPQDIPQIDKHLSVMEKKLTYVFTLVHNDNNEINIKFHLQHSDKAILSKSSLQKCIPLSCVYLYYACLLQVTHQSITS